MKKQFKLGLMIVLIITIFVEIGMICGILHAEKKLISAAEQKPIFETKVVIVREDNSDLIQKLTKKNQNLQKEIEETRQIILNLDKLINSNRELIQGVNRGQLQSIIENTIKYLEIKNSRKMVDLLMLTAQIESDLGHYYRQIKGPAVGIFQMEPATEKSIWNDYLKYRPALAQKIKNLRVKASLGSRELEYNVAYATAMAAVLYQWRKVDFTEIHSAMDMVNVYKEKFNTTRGKSTLNKTIQKLYGSKIIKEKKKDV